MSVISNAQMVVAPMPPGTPAAVQAQMQQWVQNVLVGQGVTVSNVSYTGDVQSVGKFSTGPVSTNLGMDSGLVLCTGHVSDIPGANITTSTGSPTIGGSDAQLASLIPGYPIDDAAILEFDFTPQSDTIKFNFIFASEEYPEYVSSSYNDVFGFFVTGPNPAGGNYANQNIALIPGTILPVTIDNVNSGANSAYYISNETPQIVSVIYDGLTTVMAAKLNVMPCVSYHIKIAIGDAGDAAYDSGVFLQGGSFSSNAPLISQSMSSNVDTVAVEGCNDAIISFVLSDTATSPVTIPFQISGTATNGIDYTAIQSPLVIPAGQIMNSFTVHALLDNIVEPTEYIDFTFNTTPCTTDTIRVYIKDNSKIVLTLPSDTTICVGDTMIIRSKVIGGHAPYDYLWSTGGTLDSLVITPIVNNTYSLTVSDGCGNDTTDQIFVGVSQPVFQTFGDTICKYDTAHVGVITNETYNYLWSDGQQLQNIDVIPTASITMNVVVSDSLGCSVEDSVDIYLSPAPLVILSPDTAVCDGDDAVLRAGGNYLFLWDNGVTTANNTVSPTVNTTYGVEITDNLGCKNQGQVEVDVLPYPEAVITVPVDTACKGQTIILHGEGGDQYHWSTGSFNQDISITPMQNSDYTLTVSNVSGPTSCYDDTTVSLIVERCTYVYVPSAFTPDGDGLNDKFGPVGKFQALKSFQMIIYNRWGQKVFETTDSHEMWDGTYNGVNSPNDVYTYLIIIEQMQLESYKLTGTVQLLR